MNTSINTTPRWSSVALKVLLILLLCCITLDAGAQRKRKRANTTTQTSTDVIQEDSGSAFDQSIAAALINEFSHNDGDDDDVAAVKNYYVGLNKAGKEQMMSLLYDKTIAQLNANDKMSATAIINLYSTLANKDNENLPPLLYVKGIIYTENLDSINLKKTIQELQDCTAPQTAEFLPLLTAGLEKVRNYEPPFKKMGNSIWIAGRMDWDDPYAFGDLVGWGASKGKYDNHTNTYMRCNYDAMLDTAKFEIDGGSTISQIIDYRVLGLFHLPGLFSAELFPHKQSCITTQTSDSIYILWTSEKINRNSPEIASLLRGVTSSAAAAISAEFAQRHEHSFASSLGVSLALLPVEILFNSIVDALFTPTKKMYTLEAHLKLVDDLTLTGELVFNFNKVTADGRFERKQTSCNISFSKWLPESGIMFEMPWKIKTNGIYLHPSWGIEEKAYLKDKTTRFAQFKKHGNKKDWSLWNIDQYKWLVLYNDSVLRSRGIVTHLLDNVEPSVGLTTAEMTEKEIKKHKLSIGEGAYVAKVEKNGTANISGFKDKDIILEVNGVKIISGEHFTQLVAQSRPGDWIYCKVLRKKKIIDIPLRVTWK